MLSNLLTALRLSLSFPMAVAIASGEAGWALLCFALAVVTDAVDGPVARSQGGASLAGSFFDHGSDALFVASGFAALSLLGSGTGWLALLILLSFSEYAWTFLVRRGELRSNRLGRWNGLAYFILLGTWLAVDALSLGSLPALRGILTAAALLLTATSLGSLVLGIRARLRGV